MFTVQEINKAIMFGTFTSAELNSIGDAIIFNRAQRKLLQVVILC